MTVRVEHADCRDAIKALADCSVDSCVTDPPYALTSTVKRWANTPRTEATMPKVPVYARSTAGFMGQQWDTGETAFDPAWWAEVYRVLKPGAHLVAFSGTRTYHRMACAIEDAGFEIRDQLGWMYASGFPKSHDVSKAIDKAAGAEREVVGRRTYAGGHIQNSSPDKLAPPIGTFVRSQDDRIETRPATEAAAQWQGWGTAVKPSWEPICLARKPLAGAVAANVLQHGTGALNIDGCRVEATDNTTKAWRGAGDRDREQYRTGTSGKPVPTDLGRWPANLLHDGSDEVLAEFAKYGERKAGGNTGPGFNSGKTNTVYGDFADRSNHGSFHDTGSAARFFFSAKAGPDDRMGTSHPTTKPTALLRWLTRLITPPGGLVMDPFGGSGTTAVACIREGFDCIIIEREAQYVEMIKKRLAHLRGDDTPLFSPPRRQAGLL